MNQFVLAQQLGGVAASFELGHFSREDGENVLFFDCVVGAEVGAELQAGGEELLQREVGGAFVRGAGVVEESPGLAEVIVLGHS